MVSISFLWWSWAKKIDKYVFILLSLEVEVSQVIHWNSIMLFCWRLVLFVYSANAVVLCPLGLSFQHSCFLNKEIPSYTNCFSFNGWVEKIKNVMFTFIYPRLNTTHIVLQTSLYSRLNFSHAAWTNELSGCESLSQNTELSTQD